ncbi:hypothetical protein [Pseudonocardia sp. GCM10023141]|uniref:hypothetical protein n=1 Tax=Pseudonocardia sp. GCM10023141 TaxID=3252653 RepID=UPI003611FBFC
MRHAEPREQAAQDVARLLDSLTGLRAAVDLAAMADTDDTDTLRRPRRRSRHDQESQ